MKFSRVYQWYPNSGTRYEKIVTSPVLEPTPDNPKGVYGQFRINGLDEPDRWGTCIPGDWIGEDEGGRSMNLSDLKNELDQGLARLARLERLDKAALAFRDAHRQVETALLGVDDWNTTVINQRAALGTLAAEAAVLSDPLPFGET